MDDIGLPEILSGVHFRASAMALRGLLKVGDLKREDFARATGVSEDYVSHIGSGWRRPGPRIQRGVREATGLPGDFRHAFVFFVEEARRLGKTSEATIRGMVNEVRLRDLLPALRDRHAHILFGRKDPEEIYLAQRALFGACRELFLNYGDALSDSAGYIQLCTIAVDAGLTIGSVFEVLPIALLAYAIADRLYGPDTLLQEPGSSSPWLDALRLTGMVRFEMAMYEEAYEAFVRCEDSSPVRDRPDIWIPHTTRDVLRTLANKRRFSIKEARRRVAHGKNMARSGAYDDNAAVLLCLLLDIVMVRCHIAYARRVPVAAAIHLAEASSLLDPYRRAVENNSMQDASPLHRVMFLHALASLEWMKYVRRHGRGLATENPATEQLTAMDDSELGVYLQQALTIGREAGLWNQLGKIALDFPGPVAKLAEEKGVSPYADSSGTVAFRLCRDFDYCPSEVPLA